MGKMRVACALLAAGVAMGSCGGALAVAVAGSVEEAIPRAKAQHARPNDFVRAQAEAVRSAGAVVGDDFVSQWFGARAATQPSTPITEIQAPEGFSTAWFERDGGAWRKKTALIGARQRQLPSVVAVDQNKAMTTVIPSPARK